MQRTAFQKILIFSILGLNVALSACRFGNRQDEPKAPEPNYSVEYYRDVPTTLQAFAIFEGQPTPVSNPEVDISLIPSAITEIFTDPVGFIRPKDTSINPIFFSTGVDMIGQVTGLNADGFTINGASTSSIEVLYDDPDCLTQVEIDQLGALRKFPNFGSWVLGSGEQVQLNGRLSLELTIIRVFQGACSAQLTALAQCRLNSGSCSEEDDAAAITLFSPFEQAGVIDLHDVTKLTALAYRVYFD